MYQLIRYNSGLLRLDYNIPNGVGDLPSYRP